MLKQINGLHHVTSMASDARQNNAYFTNLLGLRRIKKTVNFDAPDVYHLYYGDETGTPGSVLTYFPFPNMRQGGFGTGEVGTTAFSVGIDTIGFWQQRLEKAGLKNVETRTVFGEKRLEFTGPDNERFALVETEADNRKPWVTDAIPQDAAIRGFHSASMRLEDEGRMRELLQFMNYQVLEETDHVTRMGIEEGNAASIIDLEKHKDANRAMPGAGSVHHIAFSVDNREAQLEVRKALLDTGYQVTPVIDRDYFLAIYFRTPDGILFEVATDVPGFERDEDRASLGESLKLPDQHEHLRQQLEKHLPAIE